MLPYARVLVASLLLAPLLASYTPASAAGVPSTGVVWAPQSVIYPVDPEAVVPAPPFVPVGSAETSHPVEVRPGVGAAFFLDGLEFARVRVVGGSGTPRFRRVFGGSRSSVQTGLRALIDTGAQKDADGSWRIAEPAGDGDVWCIDADAPVRIVIEHPRTLPAKLAWEDARSAILANINRGAALPRLPGDQGSSEVEATLQAHEALGKALEASGGAGLEPAIRAWRTAAALRMLDEIRPFAWPYWSVDDVGEDLGGETERILRVDGEVASSAVWRRVGGTSAPAEVEIEGPGILRVQTRSVLPAGWLVAPTPTTVKVSRDGVLASTLVYTGRPARVTDAAEAAFPVREYLITRDGSWAGKINEVRVALAPGKHTYRIELDQTSLVRLARSQRKGFAAEALGGKASPEDWVEAAREALDGVSGPQADLVRGLVADVVGEPPPAQSAGLSPDLQLVAELLAASHGTLNGAERVGAWTRGLAGSAAPSWAWWLRVRMADLQPGGVGVRALFAAADDLPPPGLAPAAAEALGAPGLYQDRPDRGLGLLELAWRSAPGDLGVRSTYLREFLDGSSWSRQSPVVLVNGDAITPPPLTWLDTAAGTGGPVSRAARVFYRIPGGATRTVAVDPSAANPKAPAIFSMFLRSPADAGLLGLTVDSTSYRVLPMADVERLDFAMPPGEHTVALNTAAGTDAWVSGYPTQEEWRQATDIATLRSYWPSSVQGNALHFELPSPKVPVPVRLEVRVLDPVHHPASVLGHLRSDTGADWPLTVVPGIADPTLLPVGGEAPLSGVATVTVYPPPGTQQMWVDVPAEAGWVVSMSVRRTDTGTVAPPWESKGTPDVAGIAQLSRDLAQRPTDAALLLRRADQLTQLGDLEMARQDLRRLLRVGTGGAGQVRDESIEDVSERIDAAGSSGWLPPELALSDLTGAVPLSAELVVADRAAPPADVVNWVRTARTKGAEAALAPGVALQGSASGVSWIRGRLLHALNRDVEAALSLVGAYRDSGDWQFGLEAAGWLVNSEVGAGQLPMEGSGSLGYGLASELRGVVEHPTVERLALLTGRRTRWDSVRGADRSAGRARVTTADALTPPLPEAEIRAALTTPAWPSVEAQFVTAKEPAEVSTSTLTQVAASAWCQPLRLGMGGAESACTAQLFVDGVSVARETIPVRSTRELVTPVLVPGRHDVQVAIDDPGRTSALSVRFRDAASPPGGPALQPLRDSAGFFATPDQPFSMAVSGPGTVFLELRGAGGGGAVDITATGPAGKLPARSVLLNGQADRGVTVSGGPVTVPGVAAPLYIVLPTAGTWRITATPRSAPALVRGAFRQETPAPTVQRPGPMWREVDPLAEPFDWPASAPGMSAPLAGPAPLGWRGGTFSLAMDVGRQNLEAATTGGATTFDQTQLSVAWRLQAVRRVLWLHAEPLVRLSGDAGNVYGFRGDVLGRFIGPDLRLHGSGEVYSQDVNGASALGTTLAVRGYRPFRTVGGTYLIPSLEARARLLSLTTAPVGATVDADVYNGYAAAHPIALTPSLMYWAMPWQDVIAYTSVGAVTNANIVSLDQVNASLVGRAVIHPGVIPPIQLEAKYRPSYRFVSSYRTAAYLQHTVGAGIGTNVRLGDLLGLWVAVSDLGYFSASLPPENLVRLDVRFDFNGGRALQDMLPVEQDFFDLLGQDRWGDLDEDGP